MDDMTHTLLYMQEILKTLNAVITEAIDGNQALEFIKNNTYDVIFIDIEISSDPITEVIQKIRQQLRFNYTPIIVMAGPQQTNLIESTFESGASDYISKPLSKIEVLARLKVRLNDHRLDRELHQALILAERANQSKSEFITRMVHELKTPLNAMSGYSQLIELEPENIASTLENCSYIKAAAKHQEDLINEVTNLAKIEAGIIDIDLSEVELPTIIKEVFDLTKPMAEKFKVHLNLPKNADIMYKITADNKRLKQVFLNLISNAIKYNKPDGHVDIIVKQKGREIKIGVQDTGEGIIKSNIPKLFENFNRLGAEESIIEGSGIGLPITKKMIELMGGSLEIESTEGKGSTFWVNLKGEKIVPLSITTPPNLKFTCYQGSDLNTYQ